MIRQQLYEVFTKFEEHSADLYTDLAERFRSNPELSRFWAEMAREEKQHAGMLQYCRDTGMFANDLPFTEQIMSLGGLFKRLSEKVASPGLTLDGAFDVAIDLESSEINDIYSSLTSNINGPWFVIRKKLELSGDNHFEKLRAAAIHFGVPPAIQDRLSATVAPRV